VNMLVYYSLCVVLALVASSRINGSDLVTFGRDLLLSLLSTFAIVLSVYIYNDITDIEIDRVNKLDRPLVRGDLSRQQAGRLVTILGISGLALAYIVDLKFFFFSLAYFVLLFLYSFPPIRLKRILLVNKLTVATAVALTYMMGGTIAGSIPTPIFLIAVYGFVGGLSTSIIRDLTDLKGDKMGRVKNPAIVWGPIVSIRLAMAVIGLMGITVMIGFFQLGLNLAFIILASCGFAGWIYVLYPLLRRWNEPSFVDKTFRKKIAPIGLVLQACLIAGVIL
ncbi:UbiA family prenyltransferase, partial [Candidatus Bathyarchaeota archaeon]|nr:UbiA family prenyltransferase [Candidatus Bathyarchaeota archaeon]